MYRFWIFGIWAFIWYITLHNWVLASGWKRLAKIWAPNTRPLPKHQNSLLFIGSKYSSVSSSKYAFFLFTKLTTSNRHLTSRTYFSFSQHADSSDHPRLHLVLLYPELAMCHLLIVHYHASVPNRPQCNSRTVILGGTVMGDRKFWRDNSNKIILRTYQFVPKRTSIIFLRKLIKKRHIFDMHTTYARLVQLSVCRRDS